MSELRNISISLGLFTSQRYTNEVGDQLSPYLRSVFPALRHIKKIKTTKTYHKLNIDTKQTTFKVDK